jgi:hypothetical protein
MTETLPTKADRMEAAKVLRIMIANTLTAQIIEAMGARDLENGYTRKEFT